MFFVYAKPLHFVGDIGSLVTLSGDSLIHSLENFFKYDVSCKHRIRISGGFEDGNQVP